MLIADVDEPCGVQLYETLTDGTPLSPVFGTTEELLGWLVANRVSLIGGCQGTREDWISALGLQFLV